MSVNEALRALYEEDLADARTFRGDEPFIASQARRGRIEPLVAAGELRDAEDFYHAARIFQHGERLEHWAQAHLLAHTAADMGHPRARYQAAAAYDRWLMRQGQPQKYGTNSLFDGARNRVWDYDPATTDEERAAWDVPPLAELVARAERLNDADLNPYQPQVVVLVEIGGVQIEIIERAAPERAPAAHAHTLPRYLPLTADDGPRPGYLPPGAATLWRFGKLYCAKNHEGYPLITWHACGWRIAGAPDPLDPASLLATLGPGPQWLSAEHALWQRLILPTGPTTCWLVGGRLPRDELVNVAVSLPRIEDRGWRMEDGETVISRDWR
jgi:hypothetical protein